MPVKIDNLLKPPDDPTDREQILQLVGSGAVRIEQIISHGQPSPEGVWYDQPHAEWVLLIKGSATLSVAGEGRINLRAGDCLLLPGHLKHRVERTSGDAIWLAVHF